MATFTNIALLLAIAIAYWAGYLGSIPMTGVYDHVAPENAGSARRITLVYRASLAVGIGAALLLIANVVLRAVRLSTGAASLDGLMATLAAVTLAGSVLCRVWLWRVLRTL